MSAPARRRHCGHCHTCRQPLYAVQDGEQWCPTCETYRRYWSHGWGASGEGPGCPEPDPAYLYRVTLACGCVLESRFGEHVVPEPGDPIRCPLAHGGMPQTVVSVEQVAALLHFPQPVFFHGR